MAHSFQYAANKDGQKMSWANRVGAFIAAESAHTGPM